MLAGNLEKIQYNEGFFRTIFFFASWHVPPMLLVPTQSQIRIMEIPVNGTPEFVRLFQSLNKTEQIFKELDAILETLAENPKLGERVRFELIPKPL